MTTIHLSSEDVHALDVSARIVGAIVGSASTVPLPRKGDVHTRAVRILRPRSTLGALLAELRLPSAVQASVRL